MTSITQKAAAMEMIPIKLDKEIFSRWVINSADSIDRAIPKIGQV